ncbi:MAG TPA: acyltransferase [Rhizomicrobium sp.]|jgi:peptidoglycan/LPS O-acetylase OafA/YrhL
MQNSRPPEIRALLGARAIPPLILVLFHFCEGHGYRGAKWFDLPVGRGYLWVEFFFALSGFVLTYVYGGRVAEFWGGKAFVPFLKARLSRLYPLHLAMLLVMLCMVFVMRAIAQHYGYVSIYDEPYHPIVDVKGFFASLFLVQGWNLMPYLSWNGASWFVSVEWLLCLLFPFYLFVARGRWPWGVALIAVGAGALGWLANTGYGLDLTFHNGMFRGMADFAIGVGMAMVFRELQARATALPDYVFSLAQAAALAALLLALYDTGWARTPLDILTALAEMALIFALAFDRGFLAALFKTRLLLFLGEISYAVYIGQLVVLQLARHAQLHWLPDPTTVVFGRTWAAWQPVWHWVVPFAVLGAAVLWGWIIFASIEKPASAALKRWTQRKA